MYMCLPNSVINILILLINADICLFPLAGLDQQYSIPVRVQSDDSGSSGSDDDGDDDSDGDDGGDEGGVWAETSSEEGESEDDDGVGKGWASSSEGEED